jgi:SPRY domain
MHTNQQTNKQTNWVTEAVVRMVLFLVSISTFPRQIGKYSTNHCIQCSVHNILNDIIMMPHQRIAVSKARKLRERERAAAAAASRTVPMSVASAAADSTLSGTTAAAATASTTRRRRNQSPQTRGGRFMSGTQSSSDAEYEYEDHSASASPPRPHTVPLSSPSHSHSQSDFDDDDSFGSDDDNFSQLPLTDAYTSSGTHQRRRKRTQRRPRAASDSHEAHPNHPANKSDAKNAQTDGNPEPGLRVNSDTTPAAAAQLSPRSLTHQKELRHKDEQLRAYARLCRSQKRKIAHLTKQLAHERSKAHEFELLMQSLNVRQRKLLPELQERKLGVSRPFFEFDDAKCARNILLSDRNLRAAMKDSQWRSVGGKVIWPHRTGVHTFDIIIEKGGGAFVGLVPTTFSGWKTYSTVGYGVPGWALRVTDGRICRGGQWRFKSYASHEWSQLLRQQSTNAPESSRDVPNSGQSSDTAVPTDVRIGVWYDSNSGELAFSCNGRPLGIAFSGIDCDVRPAVSLFAATATLSFSYELDEIQPSSQT